MCCGHGSQKHGSRCQEQGTHRYVQNAKVYLPQANSFSLTSAEEVCVPLNYLRGRGLSRLISFVGVFMRFRCGHFFSSTSIAFLSESGWHCLNGCLLHPETIDLFNSLCILMGPVSPWQPLSFFRSRPGPCASRKTCESIEKCRAKRNMVKLYKCRDAIPEYRSLGLITERAVQMSSII